MSGKLKANYSTGETSVLLPGDFLDQSKEIQSALLKGWIQELINQLNAAAEHETAIFEKVAVEQDEPLPAHDKVAEPQELAAEKPKKGSKKAGK
jgi:hypothetical protein